MNTKQLFGMILFLLGMIGFAGCSKDSDSSGGDDPVNPINPVDNSVTVQNKATDAWGLENDIPKDEAKAFIRFALKVENLKLQSMKVFSNGWNGDLLCGIGSKSDPTKLFKAMREIAETYDENMQAIACMEEYMGSPNITRADDDKSLFDCAWDIYYYYEKQTDQLRTCLEKQNAFGNSKAQDELYSALPAKLKTGTNNSKEWFSKFNQGEYNYDCNEIFDAWYDAGNQSGSNKNTAAEKFFDDMNDLYGGKDPKAQRLHEIGKIAVTSGTLVYIDAIDKVTGGAIGAYEGLESTVNDIKDIYDETMRLREKLKNGTATTADLKSFGAVLGSKYVQEHLGDMFPDGSNATVQEAINNMTTYVIMKGVTKAQEDAAKELGINLWDILDNMQSVNGSMSVFIRDPKTGRVTVGLPSKNGNVNVVVENGKVNVMIVKGDGRTTQVIDAEGGVETFDAMPDGSKPKLKAIPEKVHFYNWNGETKTVMIRSNYETLHVSTQCDWCKYSLDPYGELTLTALPNKTGTKRPGTIIVTGEAFNKNNVSFKEQPITIPIEQDAEQEITAEADPSLFTLTSEKQTKTIKVTTNMPYISDVTSKSGWMEFKWDKQGGGKDITVKFTQNGDLVKRDGIILIGVGFKPGATEKTIEVRVTQESLANDAIVTVTPNELTLSYEKDAEKTVVFNDGGYSQSPHVDVEDSAKDWLLAQFEADGDGDNYWTAHIIATKANPSTTARTGIVTFWTSDVENPTESQKKKATLTVTQQGAPAATLTVTPDPLEFDAEGGTKQLKLTTNQPKFNSKSNSDWLTVKNLAGGIVEVTATANTDSKDREGSVTVYARDNNSNNMAEKTVKVTQKGTTSNAAKFNWVKFFDVTFSGTMHRKSNDHTPEEWTGNGSFSNPSYRWTVEQHGLKVDVSDSDDLVKITMNLDYSKTDTQHTERNQCSASLFINPAKNIITSVEVTQKWESIDKNGKLIDWHNEITRAANIPIKVDGKTASGTGTKANGAVLYQASSSGKGGWVVYDAKWEGADDYQIKVSLSE